MDLCVRHNTASCFHQQIFERRATGLESNSRGMLVHVFILEDKAQQDMAHVHAHCV